MKKYWSKEDTEKLIEYYPRMTKDELVNLFNRDWLQIRGRAQRIGVQRRNYWTDKEINILKENYGTFTLRKYKHLLPNKLNNTIYNKAKELGLKSGHFKKYSVNENFFSNKNLPSCYYAGFIAADGNLTGKYNEFTVGISKKDIKILESFKEETQYEGPLSFWTSRTKWGDCEVVNIRITSVQMTNDLRNIFNITERKTLTLKPPIELSLEQSLAFLKGYIDGDGCVQIQKNKDYPIIELLGTFEMLTWANGIVNQVISNNHDRKIETAKNIFRYRLAGKSAAELNEKLKELLPFHGLERKWSKIRPSQTFGIPGRNRSAKREI